MIVERLSPLTYLVQVDSGVFWRRHIDHLRSAHDKLVKPSTTVTMNTSLSPDVPSPSQSDFVLIVGPKTTQTYFTIFWEVYSAVLKPI